MGNTVRELVAAALQGSEQEKVSSIESIFGHAEEEDYSFLHQSEDEKIASSLELLADNWDDFRVERSPAELLAEHQLVQQQLKEAAGAALAAPQGSNAPQTNAAPTPGEQAKNTGGATKVKLEEDPLTSGSASGDSKSKIPDNAKEMLPSYPPDLLIPGGAKVTSQTKVSSAFRAIQRMRKLSEQVPATVKPTKEGALSEKAGQQASFVGQSGKDNLARPEGSTIVDSIKRLIDMTKREAKESPRKDLAEVLKEPAQKKKSDPVLQDNLQHAEEAGVKMASAEALKVGTLAKRALLEKVASAPCTCTAGHVCAKCRVSTAAKARR